MQSSFLQKKLLQPPSDALAKSKINIKYVKILVTPGFIYNVKYTCNLPK
jgi:hypothetical protein